MKRYITQALLSLAVLLTVTGCGSTTPKTPGETNTTGSNTTETNTTGTNTTGTNNTPPVAIAQSLTTQEDVPLDIRLRGKDRENNDTLTYRITTRPKHGTLSGTVPTIRYTPHTNYHGGDRLMFKVNDGSADSAEAMIYIEITSVNDAPVARDDTFEAKRQGKEHLWNVEHNDTDPEGDALEISAVGTPDHGTASDAGNGLIRYTPPGDFSGTDHFTYSVQDPDGAAASATVSVRVDKNWDHDGTQLDQNNPDIWDWSIAQNSQGDAAAVWTRASGSSRHIYASCYNHTTNQWTTPVRIDNQNTQAGHPAVALNDKGQMFAAWQQVDNNNHQQIFVIKGNAPGCSGTNTPSMITYGTTYDSTDPQIVIDANGTGITVWVSGGTTLSSAYYDPTTDIWWKQNIYLNNSISSTFRLAMDRNGNAFVTWTEHPAGGKYNVLGRFYKKSDHSWTSAQQIDDASVDSGISDVALNAEGKGWVIYPQGNAVYARSIDTEALSMGAASAHIADADTAANTHIGIDAAGNAMAIWTQYDAGKINLYALYYRSGTGWQSTATRIENNDVYYVENPQLSVSTNGDAAAVWTNHGDAYANRYRAGKDQWQTEESLIEQQEGTAHSPQISSDGNGSFTALWKTNSLSGDKLYHNRFW